MVWGITGATALAYLLTLLHSHGKEGAAGAAGRYHPNVYMILDLILSLLHCSREVARNKLTL